MFRISKVSAPDQRLVRKIRFISSGRAAVMLDVTIEYTPPETLNEQMEKERTRVVGQRKFGAMEDLAETNHQVKSAWHMILASRVHRIDGLTARNLSTLMSMDASAVAAAGGLDQEIPLDADDTTPISDQDREKDGIEADIKTVGQFASKNILFLINAVSEFRTFVETVIRDVGYFQDADWEPQVKN